MKIILKRIYAEPEKTDGYRILIDRLWPRGMKKENAHIDEWLKNLAPSSDLRKWYHTKDQTDRTTEFKKRYTEELQNKAAQAEIDRIKILSKKTPITLLTATKSAEDSYLTVLKKALF